MSRLKTLLGIGSAAWTAAFWIGGVLIPLAALFANAKGSSLLFDPVVLRIARFTFLQAAVSAAIASVIGLPLGLWIGSRGGRAGRVAELLLALPFGVPTVVAAVAWVTLLGRSGWLASSLGIELDWMYSAKAVVLAHVVFNVPWIALLVAQARLFVPLSRVEAATMLGAGTWSRFRSVAWPGVRWAFFSASTQAFAFCASSFMLVLLLGGGPPVQTLETALYSRLRYGTVDLSAALGCAFWELLLTLIPWIVVIWLRAREEKAEVARDFSPARTSADLGSEKKLRWLFRPAVAFLFFVPYLAALKWNSPSGELAPDLFAAIRVSFLLMTLTSIGAVVSALAAVMTLSLLPPGRTRGTAAVLLALPGGISVLVLGLGLWIGYGRWIDPLNGSLAAMAFLQMVLFFTIALRILWPVAQSRNARLFEAALTLGSSEAQAFFAAEWPAWRPAILSALAVVAGASLGEVAAVSLFYNENLVPLPLLISRWTSQYRFDDARFAAGLLLVLSAVTIGSVYLFREMGKRRMRFLN